MPGKRVIIKVGGSVLEDESSYAAMASGIARYVRQAADLEKVYVVVSAKKGATDRAIEALAPNPDLRRRLRGRLAGDSSGDPGLEHWESPRHSLALLWGELESAFHLSECLCREGQAAKVVTQLGLYPIASRGRYLRAELDIVRSRQRFARFDARHRRDRLIILPGFGAANAKGEPTLFGRNASDYIAAVLSALDPNVGLVIFVKDVGALFEAFATDHQRRITSTNVSRLRSAGLGQVLDRRVLEVIACEFHVVGRDIGGGTVVHPDPVA